MVRPLERNLTPPFLLDVVPPSVGILGASGLAIVIGAAGPHGGWPAVAAAMAAGAVLAAGFLLVRYVQVLQRMRRRLESELASLRSAGVDALERAGLAHDLRSPLLTVRTQLEMLAGDAYGPVPVAARDSLDSAIRASQRAQSMVERLMPVTPVLVPCRPTTDLNRVLTDVLASLDTEIAGSGARVVVGRLPEVAGDDDALFRIFVNLVQNALRYTRPGEPARVSVSALVQAGSCIIGVRDRGPGIAQHEREQVFEPGVRGTAAAGIDGSGLGLATVRELTHALKGSAWVDDSVTDGACIRVSLPLA
jgi:signal transduction histidine kinase